MLDVQRRAFIEAEQYPVDPLFPLRRMAEVLGRLCGEAIDDALHPALREARLQRPAGSGHRTSSQQRLAFLDVAQRRLPARTAHAG